MVELIKSYYYRYMYMWYYDGMYTKQNIIYGRGGSSKNCCLNGSSCTYM